MQLVLRSADLKKIGLILVPLLLTAICFVNAPRGDVAKGTIYLDDTSGKDIQEMLNSRALDSGVAIYINGNIAAASSGSQANLLIQNAESNTENQKVYIYRDDTRDCIYESDIIPPGYKVEAAKLQGDLPAGTYPCTAEFHVLSPDGTDKSIINAKVQVAILA